MRNQSSLSTKDVDLSDFQMNALCMRYGTAAAPTPNKDALITATSNIVREKLNCYEPNTRVSRRDVERAKIEVHKQYDAALRAIRDRRAELLVAEALLSEGGFER
ncbi:unnamed protein product [Cylicocyclus nassatus]|uniref:Uncharacterized protein n=1 Tax=Cylicocyclus nassatus TaxID=53992 RepID=A0AA36MA81_CYLNA|nr:unnamed protein product [Cylicocyclus nassatus]